MRAKPSPSAQLLPRLPANSSEANVGRRIPRAGVVFPKGLLESNSSSLSSFSQTRKSKQVWCWNPGMFHGLCLGLGEAKSRCPFWAALGPSTCRESAHTCLLAGGNCKEEGSSILLVKTLTSLAHSGTQSVVTNSPRHVSVLASQGFLMDTLSLEGPKTTIYNYSITRVFI